MPRDTQTASLRSRALLVKFVARSWGASKADKEASTTLNAKSQAQEGASKVTKYLIPQENLSPIRRVSAAARKVVEFNSAPWADGGLRIIATSRFADLRAEMDKFEQTHNERVNDLMDDFHELTQPERLKKWLGDLASSTDIPDADTVRSKFKLGLEVLTVPEDNDFRIDLGEEDRKALSDSIEAQLTETMNASIMTVQTRIVDRVGALAKKMSTYDPTQKHKMFDSILSNVTDLIDLLPDLNFSDDPRITEMVTRIGDMTNGIQTDDLKIDSALRAQVRDEANQIAEAAQNWM